MSLSEFGFSCWSEVTAVTVLDGGPATLLCSVDCATLAGACTLASTPFCQLLHLPALITLSCRGNGHNQHLCPTGYYLNIVLTTQHSQLALQAYSSLVVTACCFASLQGIYTTLRCAKPKANCLLLIFCRRRSCWLLHQLQLHWHTRWLLQKGGQQWSYRA